MATTQASRGLGDPRLLEIIDKLVELNIGDSVALPQVKLSVLFHHCNVAKSFPSFWSWEINQGLSNNFCRRLSKAHVEPAEKVLFWRA